jgi:hypothetical protein
MFRHAHAHGFNAWLFYENNEQMMIENSESESEIGLDDDEYDDACSRSCSTHELGEQLFEFYAIPPAEIARVPFDLGGEQSRRRSMDALPNYETWDFDPSSDMGPDADMTRVAYELVMHTLRPFVMNTALSSFVKDVIARLAASSNSYHGLEHALHVFHSMHMLMRCGLGDKLEDARIRLACYLAALCHDLDHPGLTNRFLVATDDDIAVRFNYVSPLEMHHVAVSFTLLAKPCNNIFDGVDLTHVYEFKRTFAKLILSTDIAKHVRVVDKFAHNPTDPVVLAKMAMKCCDLSHLFSSHENHLQWVARLENEFFAQGDRERLLGLPVTPFFDRAANGIGRTQRAFFKTIVLPLMRDFVAAVPGTAEMLSRCEENHQEWQRMSDTKRHVVS